MAHLAQVDCAQVLWCGHQSEEGPLGEQPAGIQAGRRIEDPRASGHGFFIPEPGDRERVWTEVLHTEAQGALLAHLWLSRVTLDEL